MNLESVSGVVVFDPNRAPRPLNLIAALPAEVRADVDAALETLEQLEAVEVLEPASAVDVTRMIADRFEVSIREGKSFDAVSEASRLIAEADAQMVVLHAKRLAVEVADERLREACQAAIPGAFVVWTRRVQELAREVDELLAAGAVLDELTARRGSKTDLQRWEALDERLREYDGIREAFTEARFLLDRGDMSDRFALNAGFMGVYESAHAGRFRAEVEQSGHPLIAGVRLGWVPWCPSRAEQLADEQESIRKRREGVVGIPGDVIVA